MKFEPEAVFLFIEPDHLTGGEQRDRIGRYFDEQLSSVRFWFVVRLHQGAAVRNIFYDSRPTTGRLCQDGVQVRRLDPRIFSFVYHFGEQGAQQLRLLRWFHGPVWELLS